MHFLEQMTYAFYTENSCLVFCGVLFWVFFLLRSSLKMLHRSIFFTLGFEPLSANQKNAPFRVLFGADDVCFLYGKLLPRFLRCVVLGFLSSALLAKNAPPEHFLYARLRAPIRKPKKCTLSGAFWSG